MMTVAAYEIAQGARPDLRGLLQRTRGFLPRMTPVILIALGVFAGHLRGAVRPRVRRSAVACGIGRTRRQRGGPRGHRDRSSSPSSFSSRSAIYVQTKLLYTIPAVAIEQVGGIDGMKRSWTLTKGEFWRTFGYYLLASLAAGAVSYVVSFVTQMTMVPMMSGFDGPPSSAEVLAPAGCPRADLPARRSPCRWPCS